MIGALINQQWSVAGWGHKDVNAMLIQPFINYNLPHGWYLTSSPIMTADWTARASDQCYNFPVTKWLNATLDFRVAFIPQGEAELKGNYET